MTPYKNNSGKSGVESYEIDDSSITVKFRSGRHLHYLYSNDKPGPDAVEKMKHLAESGLGLNSYINRHVKDQFERKW